MASLILGLRNVPKQFERIKLDNVSLENTVSALRDEIARKINSQPGSIDLVYAGVLLQDDSVLSSYGIKPGVMIHVLAKKDKEESPVVKPVTDAEMQQLVVAFKTFTLSAGYRAALLRLYRKEVLDALIAAAPGLGDDPVALAFIQDPELIVNLSNIETVRKLATLHPCLIKAGLYIAAHVREETASVNTTQASTSTGYSYSLDALSDDEEMDSSSSDPPRDGHALSRNASYNAITAAQLAAAIATAQQTYGSGNFSGSNNLTLNPPANNSVITSEMFSNAIQQAFASATQQSPTTPNVLPTTVNETIETLRTRLRPQLQQMQEIGLTNEGRNIRALQATSGDVQAAIDLVFNGVID